MYCSSSTAFYQYYFTSIILLLCCSFGRYKWFNIYIYIYSNTVYDARLHIFSNNDPYIGTQKIKK
jgi:hypothetical protein